MHGSYFDPLGFDDQPKPSLRVKVSDGDDWPVVVGLMHKNSELDIYLTVATARRLAAKLNGALSDE